MKKSLFLICLAFLMSCATPRAHPSAISFYDSCSNHNPSFTGMAVCGRVNRNAYCQPAGICSPTGNAIVAYADSLAQSIRNHEISEAEARRKWVEFRMTQVNAENQQALQRAALHPAPITCYTSGTVTNCY